MGRADVPVMPGHSRRLRNCILAGSWSCATLPGKGGRGERNEVRNEGSADWSANQTSNLVLVNMSWEGRRTRHTGYGEVEVLHGCRELELRHIAWKGGKGGERNEVRNEGSADWSANQTSNLVLAEILWEGQTYQ